MVEFSLDRRVHFRTRHRSSHNDPSRPGGLDGEGSDSGSPESRTSRRRGRFAASVPDFDHSKPNGIGFTRFAAATGAIVQTHPTWPTTANFTAQALSDSDLRAIAPSVFSPGPMAGLSTRCAFVPTCEIVSALGARGWVPVDVEQQRIRIAARLGFQKHLIRFRRAEQMRTLDEWNAELLLTNSHDALCAYVLSVGIFRRICSNGLVVSDQTFEAIRFRHAGLQADEVVSASHRIIEFVPHLGAMIDRFRNRQLDDRESLDFAGQAIATALTLVPRQAKLLPNNFSLTRPIQEVSSCGVNTCSP